MLRGDPPGHQLLGTAGDRLDHDVPGVPGDRVDPDHVAGSAGDDPPSQEVSGQEAFARSTMTQVVGQLAEGDGPAAPVGVALRLLGRQLDVRGLAAVVDACLPDASGFTLLETLSNEDRYSFPPVIVYTGRSLTSEEEQRLRRFSKSIIIKDARSPERLSACIDVLLDAGGVTRYDLSGVLPLLRGRIDRLAEEEQVVLRWQYDPLAALPKV